MQPDEDLATLVERFHEAGKRLPSRSVFGNQEMGAADRAQRERVGALQELVDRTSVDGAARLLGMAGVDVEDELRVDSATE